MIISVPKERKANEKRVGITPEGVRELTTLGAIIQIESGAGIGSGFSDEDFISAGGKVIDSLEELIKSSDIFLKVKEPASEELALLTNNQMAFSFLHPAGSKELTDALLKSQVLGLDYDLIESEDGRLHILEPMSVIAGKLSVHVASDLLLSHRGGRGLLLDGLNGVKPASVIVLGAGVSGYSAAKRAYDLGAEVTLVDIKEEKLERAKKDLPRAKMLISSKEVVKKALGEHDIVIGAVLVAGAKAPTLISKDDLKSMKQGAVFVDIAIDQGGCAETSKATSLSEPTFIVNDVIHYCVPNMPAMVPLSATLALTKETLPWLKEFVVKGIENTLNEHLRLKKGIICKNGVLTNKHVADAFGMEWKGV